MKEYKFADPFGLFGEERPIFMAHRGFTPVAPENSIVSFEAAAERGYWAIETDVHETLEVFVPVNCGGRNHQSVRFANCRNRGFDIAI